MVKKKDIEKLIIQNKESSLKNHWKDVYFYNTTKYSGEIRENEILIWRSSHFLRGAYPIFHLSFNQNNQLNGIKTENNPYYKFLNKITITFFVLSAIALFLYTNLKTTIIYIILISIIGILLHLILFKSKKYETKLLTEELKEAIENIEQLNNPELINKPKKEKVKEWMFTKILTQLLLYSFCLLILWVSITKFLPEEKILYGIFGIIIALVYPISDLLLSIGKNKNA